MILVTGGAGLNGRAVIDEFAHAGHPVRVLVRRLAKASEAGLDQMVGVELVEADMGVRAIDTADGVRGSRIALRAIMRRIETMIAAGQQAERGRQAARAELRALSARLRGT